MTVRQLPTYDQFICWWWKNPDLQIRSISYLTLYVATSSIEVREFWIVAITEMGSEQTHLFNAVFTSHTATWLFISAFSSFLLDSQVSQNSILIKVYYYSDSLANRLVMLKNYEHTGRNNTFMISFYKYALCPFYRNSQHNYSQKGVSESWIFNFYPMFVWLAIRTQREISM